MLQHRGLRFVYRTLRLIWRREVGDCLLRNPTLSLNRKPHPQIAVAVVLCTAVSLDLVYKFLCNSACARVARAVLCAIRLAAKGIFSASEIPCGEYSVCSIFRVKNIPCTRYPAWRMFRVYNIQCKVYAVCTVSKVENIPCARYPAWRIFRVYDIQCTVYVVCTVSKVESIKYGWYPECRIFSVHNSQLEEYSVLMLATGKMVRCARYSARRLCRSHSEHFFVPCQLFAGFPTSFVFMEQFKSLLSCMIDPTRPMDNLPLNFDTP